MDNQKEKVHNAINDPDVTFFLFPTPALKNAISAGEHPAVQGMTADAKAALLEGKCLPVSKDDVLGLLEGRLKDDRAWLMMTGDVRVAGAVQVVANDAVNKNVQR